MAVPNFDFGTFLLTDPAESGLSVHLAKNLVPDSEQLDLADMVPATFPGYTPQGADAWEEGDCPDESTVARMSKPLDFRCTGVCAPETIQSYYVLAVAEGVPFIVDAGPLKFPVTISAAGHNVQLQVLLSSLNADDLPVPS